MKKDFTCAGCSGKFIGDPIKMRGALLCYTCYQFQAPLFSISEIRDYLEGWKCNYGDGSPAPSLSLESVLALLEDDQDGIQAVRERRKKSVN